MKQRFGIFMAIGANTTYGSYSGTSLVKMNVVDYGTPEEASAAIEQFDLAPNGQAVFIIPFWQHTKR